MGPEKRFTYGCGAIVYKLYKKYNECVLVINL